MGVEGVENLVNLAGTNPSVPEDKKDGGKEERESQDRRRAQEARDSQVRKGVVEKNPTPENTDS